MKSCFLCFHICLLKTHKKSNGRLRLSYQTYEGDDGDNRTVENEQKYGGWGVKVADKYEDKDMEKDTDENKDLMKDN